MCAVSREHTWGMPHTNAGLRRPLRLGGGRRPRVGRRQCAEPLAEVANAADEFAGFNPTVLQPPAQFVLSLYRGDSRRAGCQDMRVAPSSAQA